MTTVQIPLLGEKWRMPKDLKEQLYEFLIFNSKANVNAYTFEGWLSSLSEHEQNKIVRICSS